MVMRYHWGLGVGHRYTQVYSSGAETLSSFTRHGTTNQITEKNDIEDSEPEDEPNTTINVAAQTNVQSVDLDSSSSEESSDGESQCDDGFEDDYDEAYMKEIDEMYSGDYDPFSYN